MWGALLCNAFSHWLIPYPEWFLTLHLLSGGPYSGCKANAPIWTTWLKTGQYVLQSIQFHKKLVWRLDICRLIDPISQNFVTLLIYCHFELPSWSASSNDCSRLWMRRCVTRLLLYVKILLHTVHSNGFSPVWTRRCRFRVPFCENCFLHTVHW